MKVRVRTREIWGRTRDRGLESAEFLMWEPSWKVRDEQEIHGARVEGVRREE